MCHRTPSAATNYLIIRAVFCWPGKGNSMAKQTPYVSLPNIPITSLLDQMVNNTQSNPVRNALALALEWHAGQKRKGNGQSYVVHPIQVALRLAQAGFDTETVAAGLGHDLLEDTNCPPQTIGDLCGSRVLTIIQSVSQDPNLQSLVDWEKKKQKYVESVRNGPVEAKAVCCVDKICNLQDLLVTHSQIGSAVWQQFNRGKEQKAWFEQQVLIMLQQTWDHPLIAEYAQLVKLEETLD